MINLQDIKKYKSFLPLELEREDIINWLTNLIDKKWEQNLWLNKFNNQHVVRYRFGDKNVVQLYLKDKTWLEIPIDMWLLFTSMDTKVLNNKCWKWIQNQRTAFGIKNKKATVCDKTNSSNILDL